MPRYFIRVVNAAFESRDSGDEYERPEAALDAGIRCAAEIVADEIVEGRQTAAAQVCVEDEKGEVVMRSVVSLSASPLWVSQQPMPAARDRLHS